MRITLLMVGQTTDKRISSLVDEYTARLSHYVSFELKVIPELKNTKSLSTDEQRQREGDLIINSVGGDTFWLLDERGDALRSVEFAAFIERQMSASVKHLVFVIGGPYGFSPALYQRANQKVSLSPMTFSHQMVRLVFTEQIYRACTILKGEPYHHE